MLGSILMLAMVIGVFSALCILFLPTGVARIRNHPNTLAVFLVNLFLGWTFVGWVAALVWACSTPVPEAAYLSGHALTLDPVQSQPALASHAASAHPAAASFHPQR